jgi:hypothetical protein
VDVGKPVAKETAEHLAFGREDEITAKLAELAEAGDVQAARLWLEYTIVKPIPAVELSGPDGEPLGLRSPLTLNFGRLSDRGRRARAGAIDLSALAGRPGAAGAGLGAASRAGVVTCPRDGAWGVTIT